MDYRYVEALRSDVQYGNEYLELHVKARQLAYNMSIDISQNNPGINLDDKHYMATMYVNEGINIYMEARWIISNPENVKILHEEAIANGMLRTKDWGPPNYQQPTQSEESVKSPNVDMVNVIAAPSPSHVHTHIRTKPYMRVRPHVSIPIGFMPAPGLNVEIEESNSSDLNVTLETDSC